MANAAERFRGTVTATAFQLTLSRNMIEYLLVLDALRLRSAAEAEDAEKDIRGCDTSDMKAIRYAASMGVVVPLKTNSLTQTALIRRGLVECGFPRLHLSEAGNAVVAVLKVAGFEVSTEVRERFAV